MTVSFKAASNQSPFLTLRKKLSVLTDLQLHDDDHAFCLNISVIKIPNQMPQTHGNETKNSILSSSKWQIIFDDDLE
jgi:hypothetical protein